MSDDERSLRERFFPMTVRATKRLIARLVRRRQPSPSSRIVVPSMLIVPNRAEFKAALLDAVATGATTLVLDFSRCSYVDSSGFGAIVSVWRKTHVPIRCEGFNEDTLRVVKLTGLDTLFEIPQLNADKPDGALSRGTITTP